MDNAEYGARASAYMARESLLEALNRFDRQLGSAGVGSRRFRDEARLAYRMVEGHQWEDEAAARMRAEKKVPVVINRVAPIVDAICGAEINARQAVRYAPREEGDVQVNELLSGAAEWVRDQCDAADEESHAFRDAVVCGFGCTETRMSYDHDPQGQIVIDRVDPLEMAVDPAARKNNFVDARYLKRTRRFDKAEARILFPELMGQSYGDGVTIDAGPKHNYPGSAYDDDGPDPGEAPLPDHQVEICEYQWIDLEAVVLAQDPATGQVLELTAEQADDLDARGALEGLNHVRMRRARYRRAFRCGNKAIADDLPNGEFSYKFITGRFDRTYRYPYGVVRSMIDPQRWSNKFLSLIDWIIASNAKGGIIAETEAFEDPRAAEQDWARADSIIWAQSGAVASGRITNKPTPPYPQGMDRLMQVATASIPEVTGVNKEMLGMADRQQPGVLEHQRKQSAYGVLAAFFDNMRRYRKVQGRLLLAMIGQYLPQGQLIRIMNPKSGQEQFVPLVADPDVHRYDVIVDEAPAGPNQRERVWGAVMSLGQIMGALQGLPPQAIFKVLEYSPLPSSLVSELREMMMGGQTAQDPAQAQALQQQAAQAAQAMQSAQVAKVQSEAVLAQARAQQAMADAQAKAQAASLTQPRAAVEAQVQTTQAAAQVAKAQADAMRAQLEAQRAPVDAGLRAREQARVEREDDRQEREHVLRALEAMRRMQGIGEQ